MIPDDNFSGAIHLKLIKSYNPLCFYDTTEISIRRLPVEAFLHAFFKIKLFVSN